jgi:site-specific recombinase XerD
MNMAELRQLTSDLPEPKDLSHHLSRSTRNRTASSVKKFYKYFAIPGIGQLGGGKYSLAVLVA